MCWGLNCLIYVHPFQLLKVSGYPIKISIYLIFITDIEIISEMYENPYTLETYVKFLWVMSSVSITVN